ncbi:endoplasmic reticulum membrane sensor NFE2L1-like [Erpetoichthys calabaricus]|uniref:endoplasmic reticulum membrane sensor NFE2L1-like n=1 Tax=Erpetoichthys calabaricus TaxID=27687 RepID=UPI0022348CC4|nr:endoplasmic reticulum membrane sensor NFE2L1-like [Erpetoichthys calabaricus]
MRYAKKFITERLIRFVVLWSLVGFRVDLDSYYFSPLLESSLGSSSAYVQTPFHNFGDTLEGYNLHPKCPDLDYYFTSRRLLNEVKALGTPHFPITEVNAWLLHAVSGEPDSSGTATQGQQTGHGALVIQGEESPLESGDDRGSAENELSKEDIELIEKLWRQDLSISDGSGELENISLEKDNHIDDKKVKESESNETYELQEQLGQSFHSSDENVPQVQSIPPEPRALLRDDLEQRWRDFLSLTELQDMGINSVQANGDSSTGMNISQAVSHNVSLQDAMASRNHHDLRRDFDLMGSEQSSELLQSQSSNLSNSEMLLSVSNLTAEFFPLIENCTRNVSNHNQLSGFLDEAVFEQINLMGLCMEGLDKMLEEHDSDSGLSINSSSNSPESPISSDMSSCRSFCEDEGAVGYSIKAEHVSWDGVEGATGGSKVCCSQYNERSPVCAYSVHHDHTYNLPSNQNISTFPPSDVKWEEEDIKTNWSEDIDLTQDERRVRALRIPFSVSEIVNMPVEAFLDLVSKYDLTDAQVTLIRDIRRRGKNKVAAQNCRKRKIDIITNLESDVEKLRMQKDKLMKERCQQSRSISTMKEKLNALYKDVFSRLRDDEGRPVNPSQYALQCNSDGSVIVMPHKLLAMKQKSDKRKKEKKR